MDKAKKRSVPLSKANLEEVIKNFADLSDLSDFDPEDDLCYANSINSPSDGYLNQTDDILIEQRLEQIIGCEDDFSDHVTREEEPIIQTRLQLLEILNDQLPLQTSEQNTNNSQLEPQNIYTQELNSHSSHNIPKEIIDMGRVSSNIQLLEQENDLMDNIPLDNLEDYKQEPQVYTTILRDRSQPREWKTINITHEIPAFEKRFKTKTTYTQNSTTECF